MDGWPPRPRHPSSVPLGLPSLGMLHQAQVHSAQGQLLLLSLCVLMPSPPSVPVLPVSPQGIPHLPCPNRTWDCHALSLPHPLPCSWSGPRFFSPPYHVPAPSSPHASLRNAAFNIEPAASYLIPFSAAHLVPPPPPATSGQEGPLHRVPTWSETPWLLIHTEENLKLHRLSRPRSPALAPSPTVPYRPPSSLTLSCLGLLSMPVPRMLFLQNYFIWLPPSDLPDFSLNVAFSAGSVG